MSVSSDVAFDIASACICAILILVRCGYRLLSRCKVHESCHRTWHVDDAYMAFALLPLVGRTSCITYSFVLNPDHIYGPATEEEAAIRGVSVAQLQHDFVLSYKLLIPGRICYALLYAAPVKNPLVFHHSLTQISSLWSLKLCLLNFYARFVHILHHGYLATQILWWFIVVSFFVVLIPTLAECRPLHLYAPVSSS